MDGPVDTGHCTPPPARWRFAHVQFDELHAQLCVHGQYVELDRSSHALLAHFVRHPGELVHKDTLLEVGWRGRIVAENTLAKAISRLRNLLGDEQGDLLRVVHGYGYRLMANIDPEPEAAPFSLPEFVIPGPTASGPDAELHVAPTRKPVSRLVDAAVMLAVLALGLAGFVRVPLHAAPVATALVAVPATGSIAVLPFADLSATGDQAYFADGLAEQLLDSLAGLPQLEVASRTSSFAYRGKQVDLPSIGRALNVETVLEGSVRTSGDRIRITVQLIKSLDGFHLWSRTYERPVTELFALQDDIAREIVAALRIELLPEQLQGMARHQTRNPEAYRLFLFGRHVWQDDETAGRRSLNAYRRAVALDPDFVDAWLALADGLGHMGLYADSAEEALAGKREARVVIDRLIKIAPRRADLYLQRAEARYAHWWDWKGAEADFVEAAKYGQPGDVDALMKLSRLRAANGRMDDALALTAQALRNNPKAGAVRGYHLLALGRCDEARVVLRQRIIAQPLDEHAHYYLGLCDLLEDKPREALAHFEDSSHVFRLTGQALAWHALGDAAASERSLQLLATRYGAITPYQVAEVHAYRGEADQAFTWLQRSAAYRDASFMYLAFDPLLDSIRGDARFAALMTQVGLPGVGRSSAREYHGAVAAKQQHP